MNAPVFVSYAHEDQDTALRIVEALEKEGIRCWVDTKGLRFTDSYTDAIDRAIRESSLVIWVASKHSVASNYVHHEMSAAHAHGKARGLVLLEPMDLTQLPAPFNVTMAGRQGAEFFRGAFEDNVAKLAADIKDLLHQQQGRRLFVRTCAALAAAVVVALAVWAFAALRHASDSTPAVAIPAKVSGLPAGDVLTVAYAGQPPAAPAGFERPRIRLAVLGRRAGEKAFKPVKDGDSLASEKDDYLIAAQALTGGYLYVFQVDSSGQKEWLFPKNESSAWSCGRNPVKPGEVVQVPAANSRKALFLDTKTGVEHIYAVFSAVRWPELERALAHKTPLPPPTGEPSSGLLAMVVDAPNRLLLRGVGGMRPSGEAVTPFLVERLDKDATLAFYVEEQPLNASGSFLVVERWFHHVAPE